MRINFKKLMLFSLLMLMSTGVFGINFNDATRIAKEVSDEALKKYVLERQTRLSQVYQEIKEILRKESREGMTNTEKEDLYLSRKKLEAEEKEINHILGIDTDLGKKVHTK